MHGAITDRPYALDDIVANGLCMGCGICRAVLGPGALTATLEADGLERPRARRPLTRGELETLDAVCPGVRVAARAAEPGARLDPMWGAIRRIARGYAADPEIRFRGASGGVLTALALHLIETGKADFVMHLAADPDRPMLSRPHRSFTRQDLLAAAGSRYTASAPLAPIAETLDEGRPFAFVGKPCDVTALESLARRDPRVDALCRYRLTLVCGGFSELQKFEGQLAAWEMRPDELVRFSFRGNGCPGPTAAEARDGRRREVPYWEMWGQEETWRSFFRCKICPDAIGLSADLVALDVWDGCAPVSEDAGWNGMIARTERGLALLEDAVASGHLTLDAEWTTADLDRTQPHQTAKRRAARARFAALRERGLPFPATEDPGLEVISLPEAGPGWHSERAGTSERLAKGAHRRRDGA